MQGAAAIAKAPVPNSWHTLFQEAYRIAQELVAPLHWRSSKGGVLPDGYDPNSIASEVILELLKVQPPDATQPPAISSRELRRRVWRHIDRLHHRIENSRTINEPDLAPGFSEDGEPTPLLNLIPTPGLSPLEFLLQKEQLAEFLSFQASFKARLGRRHRLRRLFDLLCDGISKPHDLARRLKLRVSAVANLKCALRRVLLRFPSPNLRTKPLRSEKNDIAFH